MGEHAAEEPVTALEDSLAPCDVGRSEGVEDGLLGGAVRGVVGVRGVVAVVVEVLDAEGVEDEDARVGPKLLRDTSKGPGEEKGEGEKWLKVREVGDMRVRG